MTEHTAPLFDAIVRVDRLPSGGRSVDVALDAETQAALAVQLNILSVEGFQAKLTVTPLRGGIRALGRLSALITQASVVSFEPVAQDIDEPIDRVFLPEAADHKPTPGSEVFIDLEDDDFPDHIDGPEVDLSALIIETLALAIDPYPRLDDENLDSLGIKPDVEESPFAALAKLKKTTE